MSDLYKLKRVYFTAEFIHWFAAGIPLPLYILFFQNRGLDLFQIGILGAIFAATVVLLELPTGGLADQLGRKPITIASYLFKASSSLVMLFAFALPMFVLSQVLFGAGKALASGALNAWFVDGLLELDKDIDLQPHLAQTGTVVILGLSLGTLAGGAIPTLFNSFLSSEATVFSPLAMIYVFHIALLLLDTLFVSLFVKEAPRKALSTTKENPKLGMLIKESLELSRRNPVIFLLLSAGFVSSLGLNAVETFWQPHFAQWLGVENTLWFGFFMMIAFALGVLGNMASIPLAKLFNKRYGLMAAFSQASCGLAIICLAAQSNVGFATGFLWLFYFASSVLSSPAKTLFHNEVSSEKRSTMQSVSSLVNYAASMLAGICFGFLAMQQSIMLVWFLVGGLLIAAIGFYLRIDQKSQLTQN